MMPSEMYLRFSFIPITPSYQYRERSHRDISILSDRLFLDLIERTDTPLADRRIFLGLANML